MISQDLALAEKLWKRSRHFDDEGRMEDALVDIMAAHRLFSLIQDPRVAEVHAVWTQYYQKAKLLGLLKQVQERKRR